MKAEIITIGDEILIGQIINSNSKWLANQLVNNGIECARITTVGDSELSIEKAIQRAIEDADLIIITGGLGPTNDDITKKTLCKVFDDQLILNKDVLNDIKDFFNRKKRNKILDLNNDQALVPSKSRVVRNYLGTAPALWFSIDNKNVLAFPGVPYEMKQLFKDFLDNFKKEYKLKKIVSKNIYIKDVPESQIAHLIKDWELALNKKIKLAYLPKPGIVRLSLTIKGNDEKKLNRLITTELNQLKKYIEFYESDINLNQSIHNIFIENGLSLSVAESCSSGLIASELTSFSGSSVYFKGGVIAYNDQIKTKFLGIKEDLIFKKSSVSKEVVCQMAQNVAEKFKTDFAIATTGYAGPKSNNDKLPVGTVFIAIKAPKNLRVEQFMFSGSREIIIEQVKNKALELLLHEIKNIE